MAGLESDVLIERDGRTVTITLNRPHRPNALAGGMSERLYHKLVELSLETDLTALVLRGAGADFCAGMDMIPSGEGSTARDPFARDQRRYNIPLILHTMPAVTIAAIRGACAGAGFGWACGCDLRVADTTGKFNTAFLDVGVAGDMGGPWSLSRIVGGAKARDLYFFPRRFTAQEAFEMGLIQRLSAPADLEAQLGELTSRLARAAPLALAGMKANFLEAERVDFASYMAVETNRHLLLLNTEDRVAAGADATGFETTAVSDGKGNYILNGEKWFSSSANVADIAIGMAKTDPDAPRHKRFTTFIVELPNPGDEIVLKIPTMAVPSEPYDTLIGGYFEVKIDNLVVPEANILGGLGGGFDVGQHRLAYGRLRHGMNNIAMAQRALDLAAQQVLNRSTFGQKLGERQGVQWMLADCASELDMARLVLLHIGYKAEDGLDLRQENSMAKVFLAGMVHRVVDAALQLHGALGYSLDTPLAGWYARVRAQRLVDGPDEVHRWNVGKRVFRAFEEHGTTASAAGGDLL